MLSNLRIDLDCHNSLLFPASWVGDDPYVRILNAQFGEANWSERQRIVREGLWNETALFTMRKNWCPPSPTHEVHSALPRTYLRDR